MVETPKKDFAIRTLFAFLIAALISPVSGWAADAASVKTASAVQSYVNIRSEPSTSSAIVGALRPGKSAPLAGEQKGWFAIRLAGGAIGYVSRHWTEIAMPDAMPVKNSSRRPIYAADTTAPQPNAESIAAVQPSPDRDRSVLVQASLLLQQKRPQAAYTLLAAVEPQWGGDSGFDYLYGIAALDAGESGEAIFALERVNQALPGFVGARMELARAFHAIGDYEQARQEFTALLDEQPPESVRNVIMSYLDSMQEAAPTKGDPQKRFFAMASGGYDSNANGAAEINEFLIYTLSPRNIEQESAFVEARLGGIGRRPLSNGVDLQWQGGVKHRHNPSADYVDHSFLNSGIGLGFPKGDNYFKTGIAAYWSALDGKYNERALALDLGWERQLKRNALRLSLRAGPVEFTEVQKVRDIDRVLYTLTVRQPLQGGSGELDWTLIGGRDRSDDRRLPYSNSRAGARVAARWKLSGNDLMFSLGMLKIPYNGNQDFFGIDRDDEQVTGTIAMEIQDKPVQGWTFVPNLRYINNDSNVAIFDYDRIEIGLQFRVMK